MKKSNIRLLLAICMLVANVSCAKADTADYTGGLSELQEALGGSASTRNFYQTGTINLDSNLPGISTGGTNLTINGNSFDIDGKSHAGFNVYSGQTLNFNNVGSLSNTGAILTSLKNFSQPDNGGAVIYNDGGEVNISDSVFTNNSSEGADYSLGGAIRNYNFGVQNTITRTTFDGNRAEWGGAIANYNCGGLVNINNSTFSNNYAATYGGAIYNFGYGGEVTTNITDSHFLNNSSDSAGGAIYNRSNAGFIGVNIDHSIFTGNHSDSYYGGAIFNASGTTQISNNSYFYGNYAQDAGAIFVNAGALNVSNTIFEKNYTTLYDGGAIDSEEGTNNTITDSSFKDNSAAGNGGAIYIYKATLTSTNTTFTGNKTTGSGLGGAIYSENSTLNIKDDNGTTAFTGNNENGTPNAIYLKNSTLNLNTGNSGIITFNDPITSNVNTNDINVNSPVIDSAMTKGIVNFNAPITSAQVNIFDGTTNVGKSSIANIDYRDVAFKVVGGTQNFTNVSLLNNSKININDPTPTAGETTNITGSTFNGASYTNPDRAINVTSGNLNVASSNFLNHTLASEGGAIYNSGTTSIGGSSFSTNSASNSGGAIYNTGNTSITGSVFSNNTAKTGDGGAIYNSGNMTLVNTSFTENASTAGNGGAIYNSGTLNVVADGGRSTFTGNKTGNTLNAIYLTSGSTLNLNSSTNSSITFNDKITADVNNTAININKSGITETNSLTQAPTSGAINLNNTISASNVNLYGGTLNLGTENLLNGNTLNISGSPLINMINGSLGTMELKDMNLAANSTANLGIDVNLARQTSDRITAQNSSFGPNSQINISRINALTDATGSSANINVVDSNLANYVTSGVSTVMGPIFKYNVNYDSSNGMMGFSNPGGGSYTDYNPSILSKTVSSLTGTYLNQVNVYSEALGRAELFMSLPQTDRLLMRYENKYASAEDPMVFSPLFTPSEKGGLWVKQYTSFENIPLNNGPNVSNVGYGALIGADTAMKHMRHGCDGYLTAYVGYNGSHQNYDRVGIYQNGGVLGMTGTLYKNNFFTALTANVGATNGNASTMFGTDNFTTLLAGLGWKSGYNIELMRGKIIIQPTYAMSYTFANTFDYETASGMNITSDPLNALQIAPGVKIIGNLKNGWQPFLAANMVWNIMDAQRFRANSVELPMMTIDPYVEYGFGAQRRWGERFTGFGQAMLRGGGRNGIALQFGFRVSIGK